MMSLKTARYLHRPITLLKSPFSSPSPSLFSPPCRRRHPYTPVSMSTSAAPAATSTVEHVVLFKVRDSTDPSKIESMISNLQSLTSLGIAVHLTATPILRRRSAAADGFTHLLHSRYQSPSELASYASDPRHVSVVKDYVVPICDDIMALDWVADLSGGHPAPGSAVRLTLAKPKEGKTKELLEAVERMKGSSLAMRSAEQVSFGENISPARAKGYEIGFLAVFDGVEALDGLEKNRDLVEGEKDKVRPLIDSVIVVDFVVPALKPAAAAAASL